MMHHVDLIIAAEVANDAISSVSKDYYYTWKQINATFIQYLNNKEKSFSFQILQFMLSKKYAKNL